MSPEPFSQPVPRGRQPGTFPNRIQPGFPSGGMSPSPALYSLETLRSSIYAGIDKHGKESLGAVKKRNAGQPGSGRSKESVADERLTAGKGGKEGWQEISAQDIWQCSGQAFL